jgi:competence protein ComEA
MPEPVTFFITWSTDAGPPIDTARAAPGGSLPAVPQPTPPTAAASSAKPIPLFWPGPVQLAVAVLILASAAALGMQAYRMTGPQAEPALNHVLDLNEAGVAELSLLPGVGPKLAQRIVDYRQRHGPFRRIDDLKSAPGVGPATLARLRPRLTVDESPVDAEIDAARPGPAKAKSAKMTKSEMAAGTEIIDVNRATAAELRRIPGIGPKISQNIVDSRSQQGPFRTVDDLCRVKGIKTKMLEKIKPYVAVDVEREAQISLP